MRSRPRHVVRLDHRSRTSDLAAAQWTNWVSAAFRLSVVIFRSHRIERFSASASSTLDRFCLVIASNCSETHRRCHPWQLTLWNPRVRASVASRQLGSKKLWIDGLCGYSLRTGSSSHAVDQAAAGCVKTASTGGNLTRQVPMGRTEGV